MHIPVNQIQKKRAITALERHSHLIVAPVLFKRFVCIMCNDFFFCVFCAASGKSCFRFSVRFRSARFAGKAINTFSSSGCVYVGFSYCNTINSNFRFPRVGGNCTNGFFFRVVFKCFKYYREYADVIYWRHIVSECERATTWKCSFILSILRNTVHIPCTKKHATCQPTRARAPSS